VLRSRRGQSGFTLLELLVVSILMVGVTAIAADMWRYLSVGLTDLSARSRVAGEMRLAVESLRQDLGPAVGAIPLGDGSVLLICRDGGDAPDGVADWINPLPDPKIRYYLDSGKLMREDQSTSTVFTVAEGVTEFSVIRETDTVLRIHLVLARRDLQRDLTFRWSQPT
jgi:prepilin-type N-terminal cleavage/methylation domain-containing protein